MPNKLLPFALAIVTVAGSFVFTSDCEAQIFRFRCRSNCNSGCGMAIAQSSCYQPSCGISHCGSTVYQQPAISYGCGTIQSYHYGNSCCNQNTYAALGMSYASPCGCGTTYGSTITYPSMGYSYPTYPMYNGCGCNSMYHVGPNVPGDDDEPGDQTCAQAYTSCMLACQQHCGNDMANCEAYCQCKLWNCNNPSKPQKSCTKPPCHPEVVNNPNPPGPN